MLIYVCWIRHVFKCVSTDYVGSTNTVNICLILSTFTVLFLRVLAGVGRGPSTLLWPGTYNAVKTALVNRRLKSNKDRQHNGKNKNYKSTNDCVVVCPWIYGFWLPLRHLQTPLAKFQRKPNIEHSMPHHKTWGIHIWSRGRVSSSCSISDIRRVSLQVSNPATSHKWEKKRIMITNNKRNISVVICEIFRSG